MTTQIITAAEFDAGQALDLLRLTQTQLQLYRERHAAAAEPHREAMGRASRTLQHLKETLEYSSSLDEIRAAMIAKEAADEQVVATNNEVNRLFKICQDLDRDVNHMKRYLLQRLREE